MLVFRPLPFVRHVCCPGLVTVFLIFSSADRSIFAQGSLTPPAAPAATLKTLNQVEPRTPIPAPPGAAVTYPIIISAPGSYYLTQNLSPSSGNAINITADNVSLDLNGFTISSTSGSASGNAIDISGRSNIAISNGNIHSGSTVSGSTFTQGSGFVGGINWGGGAPSNVRVSGVTVTGVSSYPLDLGFDKSSVVQNCTVRICSQYGIQAGAVSDSAALQCGSNSIIAATILNCVGSLYSTSGNGFIGNTPVLDQRVPVSSLPVTLDKPGSYYLTANLNTTNGDAITISASGVTLDLNGFSILCNATPPAGVAVAIANVNDITIKNGHIRGGITYDGTSFTGPGFDAGISTIYNPTNVSVSDVTVSGCGAGGGINLTTAPGSVIRHCVANNTAGDGLDAAVVVDSVVQLSGGVGINGLSSVINCLANSNSKSGIISGRMVVNSYGTAANAATGIAASLVVGSFAQSANGAGILADSVSSSYGIAGQSGVGISADGTVTSSFGQTASGRGIASGIIAYSSGAATANGTGISAGGYVIGGLGSAAAGGTPIVGQEVYSYP